MCVISLFEMKMVPVPISTDCSFMELGMDGSAESVDRLLDSQKKLFYSQVDQLQRVVVTHCKLTGANPLSQEMAAGALSIKIGKKPRDLLNPKAVKCMKSVFAIKDVIGKKETREISALCGVTVTQVREFFSGQKSKVRKLVNLAREKAVSLDESEAVNGGCTANSDATPLCGNDALLSAGSVTNVGEPAQISSSNGSLPAIQCDVNVTATIVDAKPIQAISAPAPSSQEEPIPGIDEDDKKFLENIFNLMRKEGTFSGQVKLMEWILQINNSAVLVWFSTKGSITILATWLSQAAIEEQTTVLYVILKVLCHLPLHKALPAEISTILQTVNKLRFYRTPDISNRARILLSRWSKLLVRNPSLKYPSSMNSKNGVQKEIFVRKRINEILSGEFWQSKIGISEDTLALTANNGKDSKSSSRPALKFLTTSCDSSSRNQGQNASVKIKGRRTVRLVEQLDEKPAERIAQVGRAALSKHSRPISADDIQKAKLHAMYMQHKYGKADTSPIKNKQIEAEKDSTPPQSIEQIEAEKDSTPPQSIKLEQEVNTEEEENAVDLSSTDIKPTEVPHVDLLVRLKSIQIQWLTPPEMKIDSSWRVGEAESSKEVEVQAQRIRREKEIFYPSTSEIPPNPKEPWDIEMDFDDSLTPEIPVEQPPDTEAAEDYADHPVDDPTLPEDPPAMPISSPCNTAPPAPVLAPPAAFASSSAEPDLELLAVLLKNPELVFALTSGQGKNLTNNERVALLDMIKHSNGMRDATFLKPEESVPLSLPSPTPPTDSERATSWRSTFPSMDQAKAIPLQPQFPVTALPSFLAQTHTPPQTAALQSSQMPQMIMNPASQAGPIGGFISQGSNPSLHQNILSSGYMLQQGLNATPLPPPAPFQQDILVFNPTSMPIYPQTQQQLHLNSEPSTIPTSWTWQDQMPESSMQRQIPAEYPLQDARFDVSDSSHNDSYWRHQSLSIPEREEFAGRSSYLGAWSPESTSNRFSEVRHGHVRSYSDSRSEQGWNYREGDSRRWTGYRTLHRQRNKRRPRNRERDRS